MSVQIRVADTKAAWIKNATQGIINLSRKAVAARGKFSLVLSGGSTPAPVYQALADADLDWDHIFLFWGDERCVPPDSPESNYKLVKDTLLAHAPIPADNIYRIKGELEPSAAAKHYHTALEKFFEGQEKRFDLVLLGLGTDGHTASLFPKTPALHEKTAWVIENQHPETGMDRITLTYPAILSARNIFFLVQGEGKAHVVQEVIENPDGLPHYPAKEIKHPDSNIVWYLDREAAKHL